jgi:hypothetical protein
MTKFERAASGKAARRAQDVPDRCKLANRKTTTTTEKQNNEDDSPRPVYFRPLLKPVLTAGFASRWRDWFCISLERMVLHLVGENGFGRGGKRRRFSPPRGAVRMILAYQTHFYFISRGFLPALQLICGAGAAAWCIFQRRGLHNART